MSGSTDQLYSDAVEYAHFCAEIEEAKTVIKEIDKKRKELGERIKVEMKKRGITQIGTDNGTVIVAEKEKKETLNFDYLAKTLESVLRCDPDKADGLANYILENRGVEEVREDVKLEKPKKKRAPKERVRKRERAE